MSKKKAYENSRRKNVFEFIVAYKKSNDGLSPTVREICRGVGITSTSVAAYYLAQLVDDGKIELINQFSRGIKVTGGE